MGMKVLIVSGCQRYYRLTTSCLCPLMMLSCSDGTEKSISYRSVDCTITELGICLHTIYRIYMAMYLKAMTSIVYKVKTNN